MKLPSFVQFNADLSIKQTEYFSTEKMALWCVNEGTNVTTFYRDN
jgi:hypothetical protein